MSASSAAAPPAAADAQDIEELRKSVVRVLMKDTATALFRAWDLVSSSGPHLRMANVLS